MDSRYSEVVSTTSPKRAAGRPRRLPDSEVRDRVLAATRSLLEPHGLGISLGAVSFEDAIQTARVSRSAAYRIWPSKDDFVSDVLVALASDTAPGMAAFDEETIKVAVRTVAAHPERLETAEGRREAFLEACRHGANQNFGAILSSTDWRTYIALEATVAS